MNDLDAVLLRAHEEGDKHALVSLYAQAADEANDADAAGFYRTHAYVFALDVGHPRVEELRAMLVAEGREE